MSFILIVGRSYHDSRQEKGHLMSCIIRVWQLVKSKLLETIRLLIELPIGVLKVMLNKKKDKNNDTAFHNYPRGV